MDLNGSCVSLPEAASLSIVLAVEGCVVAHSAEGHLSRETPRNHCSFRGSTIEEVH